MPSGGFTNQHALFTFVCSGGSICFGLDFLSHLVEISHVLTCENEAESFFCRNNWGLAPVGNRVEEGERGIEKGEEGVEVSEVMRD